MRSTTEQHALAEVHLVDVLEIRAPLLRHRSQVHGGVGGEQDAVPVLQHNLP